MAIVLLEQINSLNRAGDEDYVDKLRKSVVKLFSYIVISIGTTNGLKKKLTVIMSLLEKAVLEDIDYSYTSESIDLICDIRSTFGLIFINHGWVNKFLANASLKTSNKGSVEKANRICKELNMYTQR